MQPKECPVCGFNDFKETPTKFKCNLCGKTVFKEYHQKKMIRKRPLNPDRLQEELGE